MRGIGIGVKICTVVGAAVFVFTVTLSPAYSGTDGLIGDPAAAQKISSISPEIRPAPDPVQATDLTITHASGLTRPPSHGLTAEVKALLAHLSSVQRRKYERASADFPEFCQEWERRLHDREMNNLEHISWQRRSGYQTATYVAYSKVEACDTKETSRGVPIGKLSYEEYNYYLTGKTVDEAKHATPKLIGRTNTLEIFSWEKDRWFY
jgi:hypothetical protein